MKPCHVTRRDNGLTLVEVIFILAVLALLAAFLFPLLARPRRGDPMLRCRNNLKQVGLGFQMFANDFGGKFPWQVPVEQGGTLEFASSPDVFRHFRALSNEMASARIFVCRNDYFRQPTNMIHQLMGNEQVGYFVGVDAGSGQPQMFLAGDRNLSTSNSILSGVVTFTTASHPTWTTNIHQRQGNVLLVDGSIHKTSAREVTKIFGHQTNFPLRLAFP